MAIAFAIFGIAFAAFCVWLGIRVVNRRERWAKWTAVGLVVVLAYPLSFGPARWIAHQDWCPMWTYDGFFILYWPMLRLAEHAPEPIVEAIRWWLIICEDLLG